MNESDYEKAIEVIEVITQNIEPEEMELNEGKSEEEDDERVKQGKITRQVLVLLILGIPTLIFISFVIVSLFS